MLIQFANSSFGGPVAINRNAIAAISPLNEERTYIYLLAARNGGDGGGLVVIVDEPYAQVVSQYNLAA